MLPDLHGEFFSEIIRGADQAARARGLHLLVSTSHGDAPAAIAAMRAMRGRVDGLVMMSPHVDLAILADNLVGSFPTVLINTPVPGAPHPAFCIDNYAGARLAVEHLAMAVGSAGGSVAHIAGPATNHEARDRRRGFHDALAHVGGLEGPVLPGDFTESSGYAAGMALADMPKRPAAVFAANDEMAIGCMLALEARGLAVPSDILLVGFDDIPISRLLRPALTTVRVNIADLSRRAMERLVQTMTDKAVAKATVETLKPSLVVRESSTPPFQA
jgi:LacI family transcriptional regulator